MNDDKDIKIAGSRPSKDIRSKSAKSEEPDVTPAEHDEAEKARSLGLDLATQVTDAQNALDFGDGNQIDDVLLHRRILLCFAVVTGLERFSRSASVARIALNAFYNALKRIDYGFYDDLSSTGAFSFYYLAVRRHGDLERRIGQTFAMLCGHDGDPVFQELGETLYCSYSEMVRICVKDHGLLKEQTD